VAKVWHHWLKERKSPETKVGFSAAGTVLPPLPHPNTGTRSHKQNIGSFASKRHFQIALDSVTGTPGHRVWSCFLPPLQEKDIVHMNVSSVLVKAGREKFIIYLGFARAV
jgi:hypothetical protein